MRKASLAAISGLLLSLSFPSWACPAFSAWAGWLAWVGLIPLMAALENQSAAKGFLNGWIAGFAFFASALYWILAIEEMGPVRGAAWLSFAAMLGGYWGLWALGCVLARHVWPAAACFLVPGLWAATEIARGSLFTGFPWVPLGASQWQVPGVFLASRILGTCGVSAGIVAANAALWSLIRRRPDRMWASAAAAAWLLVLGTGSLIAGMQVRRSAGPAFRAACLQGNFTEEEKNSLPQSVMLERYLKLGGDVLPETALAVWPETATAGSIEDDPLAMLEIEGLARKTGAAQLVGAIRSTAAGEYLNGAFLVTDEGVRGAYFKRHLVPFGEYIPGWMRRSLPFVGKLTRGLADFSPGKEASPLVLPEGPSLGVLICYEAIFAAEVRELVGNGAAVLVNLTNDAWYRNTAASYQHALGPISRAVEFGRYVVRCANTGVSLIADPAGDVPASLPLFVQGRLEGRVAALEGRTFFCAAGNWPLALYFAAVTVLIFGKAWQGRISLGQESGEA